MRKITALAAALLFVAAASFGGVIKSQKSAITFKGFGSFNSTVTEKLAADKMAQSSESKFDGKGLMGSLVVKNLLPSGKTGQIIDLAAMTLTSIDVKRKTYTVEPIQKFAENRRQMMEDGQKNEKEKAKEPAQESEYKILKSDFKVEASGETKTINGFACRRFTALWTVEWENTRTKDKGTDKLETVLWNTPLSGEFKAALAEEQSFYAAYMKAMGFDSEKAQRDILGTEWLNLLALFDPAGGKSKLVPDKALLAKEMKKIEGTPIVIDGKYFPAPKPKAAEEEEPSSGGGLLGKLGKSLLKKKPNPEEENAPAIAFYTEVTSLSAGSVEAEAFQPPADYKKK
jgi:hypothetical protein